MKLETEQIICIGKIIPKITEKIIDVENAQVPTIA